MKLKGFMVLNLFGKVEKNRKTDLEDLRVAARGDFGVSGATHTATAPFTVQTHTSDSGLIPKEKTQTSETVNELSAPTYSYMPEAFGYGPFSYADFNYKNQSLLDAARNRVDEVRDNWNPEEDISYKTYARQYTRSGEDALRNTMARLASRTGGVASSYAVQAAQGAYNNYLQELANKVPELYNLAYNKALEDRDYWEKDLAQERSMYDTDWSHAKSVYDDQYDAALRNWQAKQSALKDQYDKNYALQMAAYENQQIEKQNAAQAKAKAAQDKIDAEALQQEENDKRHQEVYKQILDTAKAQKNQSDAFYYLTKQFKNGLLTEDEMDYIYDTVLGYSFVPRDVPIQDPRFETSKGRSGANR